MRVNVLAPILGSFLFFTSSAHAVETKPNFSGTWILDRDKSQLGDGSGRSHHQGGGGRMGGSGMGIPGLGIPGMGGPRMGGPGMGGRRSGGPGMGGTGTSRDSSAGTSETDRPRGPRIPETLVIEHSEPQLTIQQKTKFDDEEQVRELKYTTDGNTNRNEGFRGYEVESHTAWKENHLETKSTIETSRGTLKITELRSLSPDGKTMTVEIKSNGGEMERQQKLIYVKQ